MGTLDGKVAFITGAARGQGRSHAIRLAEEGADIIAVDICAPIESMPYAMGSAEELAETVARVEALGRRIIARPADVRDRSALRAAVTEGVSEFGGIDIVLANAGIAPFSLVEHDDVWKDVIDVNLTGVFNTIDLTTPGMVERDKGGVVVITGSTAAQLGFADPSRGSLSYGASKHALVGLMRNYANILAPHSIRVVIVHPTGVNTYMANNPSTIEVFASTPGMADSFSNALPVTQIEPIDISNAIAWLASDAARYVTGIELPVDAGFYNKK